MGRLLKPALLKIGYLAVNLHKNDGGKTTYVHALVANTFLGIQALSMDVCHNDGIKTNNRVDNLRYDSRRNNLKDCDKHGTRVRGGKASWSKVTEQDVIIIRRLRKETGLTNKQIGEIFGLKAPSISLICSRKNWAHVL